jgi:O-antigen/teichoic acid export membrane protein
VTSWQRLRATVLSERRFGAMAGTIFGGQVVSGLLGFVFWAVAAHSMSTAALGVSGASTAAMTLLGPLGMLGVGTLLIAELPRTAPEARRRLICTGLGVVVLTGGLLGLLFIVLGAPFLQSYEVLVHSPATAICFVLGCALTGLSNVLDQVMLVVGAPTAQLGRTVVSGVVKLGALVVLTWLSVAPGVGAALLAWAVGLVAGAGMAVRALRQTLPATEGHVPTVRRLLSQHASGAMQHHGVNVALFFGSLLQPVIIGGMLSAQANADFTAARLTTMFAFLAPFALAMAFFASSAGDPRAVVSRSATVTRASLALALTLTAALWVGGRYILDAFGGTYEEALTSVRIMSLGVPLLVFKDQYIAVARSTNRMRATLLAVAAGATLEIVATVTGGHLSGLQGALTAWVVVLGIEAVYSFFALRRIRRDVAAEVVPAVVVEEAAGGVR